MSKAAADARRRTLAKESFKTAAECIGPITPGMAIFAITRGQFSMVDALMHVLDCVGPARISVWTWTAAAYELKLLSETAQRDGRILAARLMIDGGVRRVRAPEYIAGWKERFGPDSIRYIANHAKIATVETAAMKVLMRGSMNLNHNPRFEQFDLTEGGVDFDLVRRIEEELPIAADDAASAELARISRTSDTFGIEKLSLFKGTKTWTK